MDKAAPKVYDNGGQSRDRYTVINKSTDIKLGSAIIYRALIICEAPHISGGISQWVQCIEGKHLGNEISFHSLPDYIKRHVSGRFAALERITIGLQNKSQLT
jgi:hypothetical protein